jgi:hypothetical protein
MISVSLNYEHSETNTLSALSDTTAEVQLDLFDNSIPVISGAWQCTIRYNGKRIRQISNWHECCSQNNDDDNENICELIELESELEYNFRLKRLLLLDSANQIFLACDLILHNPNTKKDCDINLQYESSFIYSDKLHALPSNRSGKCDIIFQPNTKLRGSQKPVSFRIIPLATSMVEFLRAADSKLRLKQNCCYGSSMFVPLWFDLKTSRLNKTTIWKELTIGENMEKVTSDKAVGFRIQIDKEQFLLYYSLTSPQNRTLLGHNLIDKICYAAFNAKSGVIPLLTK